MKSLVIAVILMAWGFSAHALPKCNGRVCTVICVQGVPCIGSDSNNVICGTPFADEILAKGGTEDHICGGAGDDYIDGGAGVDLIYAGDGNDIVFGKGGNDYINGDAGNDLLIGGSGFDEIQGSYGIDDCFSGEIYYGCESQ